MGASLQAGGRDFYIDYANGKDSSDGRSPATAWKHGPGDGASTGSARKMTVLPGDRFIFKGGVRYRGTVAPRGSGTVDAPVILDGSSWGPTKAIIDGSNPLGNVRRCKSASDCLGNPHWRNLWRGDIPPDSQWTDWIFVDDTPFQPAQYPDVGQYEADDVDRFLTIPLARLAQLQAGQIQQNLPKNLNQGAPSVALWVTGNAIAYADNARISTSGVDLTGATWQTGSLSPYTNRDNKFAIVNAPALVSRPGLFAMSPKDGVAIIWPQRQTTRAPNITTGGQRSGVVVNNLDGGVIHGFSFANFSSRKGKYNQGVAILSGTSVDRLTVSSNSIQGVVNMGTGRSALYILGGSNITIKNNSFRYLPATSAIMIDNSNGPVTIRCNSISYSGRTGVRFSNVVGGKIIGNDIKHLNGIHGNGLTVYQDVRDIEVIGNVVTDTVRPFTTHGAKTPRFSHGTEGVLVKDNVFVSTSSSNAALISYGNLDRLVVLDNFLAAPHRALRLNGSETNFHASGNTIVGTLLDGKKHVDVSLNHFSDPAGNGQMLVAQKTTATPSRAYCS